MLFCQSYLHTYMKLLEKNTVDIDRKDQIQITH